MSLQDYMSTSSCLVIPKANIPRHLPLHLDIIVPILKYTLFSCQSKINVCQKRDVCSMQSSILRRSTVLADNKLSGVQAYGSKRTHRLSSTDDVLGHLVLHRYFFPFAVGQSLKSRMSCRKETIILASHLRKIRARNERNTSLLERATATRHPNQLTTKLS